MNVNTGATYPSLGAALDAGESSSDLVEVIGTAEQVERLAENVARGQANQKARNRARNKQARQSRRRNR